MEDFVRLNLNAAISGVGFLVTLIIAYVVTMKVMKNNGATKEHLIAARLVAGLIFLIIILSTGFNLLHQVSVNQLPKSTIDKSYLEQKQESYKERVSKEAQQSKENQ